MPANKSENLNMRVRPHTKQALRLIADREKRSMANALECLVDEYITRNQIQILPEFQSRKGPVRPGGLVMALS